MSDGDRFERVRDDTLEYSEKERFTPEEHQALKDAVFSDLFRRLVFSDRSYFVLGNYDGGPREARLELVCNELERHHEDAVAFLMKDVPEAWEFWTTKFKILADRATYIVPVLEDSHGSHHWESGQIDQPKYRPKVHVLKRDYGTEAAEREHFGAMVAHFVEVLDRDGRVYRWSTEEELRDRVRQLPP